MDPKNLHRSSRSIWPFTTSYARTSDYILTLNSTDDEVLLSKRIQEYPLRRNHKYQEISRVDIDHVTRIPDIDTKSDQEQNYVRVVQSEISQTTDERDPTDLSFLDDLGGLAHFLPDVEDITDTNEKTPISETNSSSFFSSLLSKLLQYTKVLTSKDEESDSSFEPGFLESVFGINSSQKKSVNKALPEATIHYLPSTKSSYVNVEQTADINSRLGSRYITGINFHNMTLMTLNEIVPTVSFDYPKISSVVTSSDDYHNTEANNRFQTIHQINNNLSIRNAISHENIGVIKDKHILSRIYTGYSRVRQSNG